MNRCAFVAELLAFVSIPALASGKEPMMNTTSLISELKAKEAQAMSLTIRHVGAYISTLTTITSERLAHVKPLHETTRKADIKAAFAAIEAAEPAPSGDSSEPRWHLTFSDKSGTPILVATTAIAAPRHGTIGGQRVMFHTPRLVHWLAEHYAPDEVPASR